MSIYMKLGSSAQRLMIPYAEKMSFYYIERDL